MTSTITVDTALILQPLTPDNPCGEDLRYDPVYDRIPELARSEPEGLPMGIWEREIKKSDWNAVVAVCHEVLVTRSKDLQVAAWLCEALLHLHDLPGAAQGWQIFSGLTTRFWDDVFPRISDGDVELRLRPMYWLVERTGQWLTWRAAQQTTDRNQTGSEAAKAPLEIPVQQECAALRQLLSDMDALRQFVDLKLGANALALHALEEPIRNRLAMLASASAAEESVDAGPTAASETDVIARPRRIDSRDAAYAAICEVALYLARTEPHSPVPMILNAIADWRDCQFNDLLTRMPKDNASLYELIKFFKKA